MKVEVTTPSNSGRVTVSPSSGKGKHVLRTTNRALSQSAAIAFQLEDLIELRDQLDAYIQAVKAEDTDGIAMLVHAC